MQEFVGVRRKLVKQDHDPPKPSDPLNKFASWFGPADVGPLPAQSGFTIVCT